MPSHNLIGAAASCTRTTTKQACTPVLSGHVDRIKREQNGQEQFEILQKRLKALLQLLVRNSTVVEQSATSSGMHINVDASAAATNGTLPDLHSWLSLQLPVTSLQRAEFLTRLRRLQLPDTRNRNPKTTVGEQTAREARNWFRQQQKKARCQQQQREIALHAASASERAAIARREKKPIRSSSFQSMRIRSPMRGKTEEHKKYEVQQQQRHRSLQSIEGIQSSHELAKDHQGVNPHALSQALQKVKQRLAAGLTAFKSAVIGKQPQGKTDQHSNHLLLIDGTENMLTSDKSSSSCRTC